MGHLSLVVLGFTVRHARSGTTLMAPAPATVWATDSDAAGPRPLRARPRCDGTATVARSTQARRVRARWVPDSDAA